MKRLMTLSMAAGLVAAVCVLATPSEAQAGYPVRVMTYYNAPVVTPTYYTTVPAYRPLRPWLYRPTVVYTRPVVTTYPVIVSGAPVVTTYGPAYAY